MSICVSFLVALDAAALFELSLQLLGLLTFPLGVALPPAEIEHVVVRFRRDGFRGRYQLLADGALHVAGKLPVVAFSVIATSGLWLCRLGQVKQDCREPD